MSDSGWTDDFLCKQWLEKSFIPQSAERNTSGKPILLIYDGHGSHDTLDVITISREHNVLLFCLPPHTTHKLQPLDVGVFGPFQRAWADRCDELVDDTGEDMPREDVVKHYMDVRQQTFKKSTIISAFRKSGCWPINPNIFTDEDYAPSIRASTSAIHVPSSFPGIPTQSVACNNLDLDSGTSNASSRSSDENEQHNENSEAPNGPSSDPSQLAVLPPIPDNVTPPMSTISTSPIPGHIRSSARLKSHPGRQTPAPSLQAENAELRAHVAALESRVATAEAHAKLAYAEVHDLKRQLNTKTNKSKKRRKLNVDARWLNSDEGLRVAQEQEATRAAEEERRREVREQRTARQAERDEQRRQRDPNAPFTGTLATKAKADLQDIAQALELESDGQRKDILARINTHFDTHPHLCEDTRFEGMFNRTRRRTVAPIIENHPPTPTASDSAPPLAHSESESRLRFRVFKFKLSAGASTISTNVS